MGEARKLSQQQRSVASGLKDGSNSSDAPQVWHQRQMLNRWAGMSLLSVRCR